MDAHCLTDEQIERCRQKRLLPEEIVDVYRHVGGCEACRLRLRSPERTPFMGFRAEMLLGDWQDEVHLTDTQGIGFVDHTLDETELQMVSHHLESCPACVEQIRRLRSFRVLVSTYPPSAIELPTPITLWSRLKALFRLPSVRFTLFALAPAFAFLLLLFVLRPRWFAASPTGDSRVQQQLARELNDERLKRQLAEAEAQKQQRIAQDLARQNDLSHQHTTGTTPQTEGDRLAVAEIERGEWNLSQAAAEQFQDWKRQPAYLGVEDHPKPTTVALLSPVNTFVMSTRPLFRWRKQHPGRYYRLILRTGANISVMTIPIVKGETEWRPNDKLLQPGHVYMWWLDELDQPDAGATDVHILGTSARAHFKILDAATEAQVKRAQIQYAGSPLQLGLYYYNNGLFEDARAKIAEARMEFERDTQAAARLLKQLPPVR